LWTEPRKGEARRAGFMASQFSAPKGFVRMGGEEIEALSGMSK
jgi:hypothetical protein